MRTARPLAMLLAVGMVPGMGSAAALGTIVVTPDTTGVTRIGFEADVLGTDLANNDQPTFLSATDTVANGGGGPVAVINDGTSGPNNDSGFRGYQSPNFLRINLNTTLNPQGYDITGITSFAGHPDWRASQDYDVSLALVGDPGVFTTFLDLNNATLEIRLWSGGGTLSAGQSFELLVADEILGSFDSIILPTLPGGLSFDT